MKSPILSNLFLICYALLVKLKVKLHCCRVDPQNEIILKISFDVQSTMKLIPNHIF